MGMFPDPDLRVEVIFDIYRQDDGSYIARAPMIEKLLVSKDVFFRHPVGSGPHRLRMTQVPPLRGVPALEAIREATMTFDWLGPEDPEAGPSDA